MSDYDHIFDAFLRGEPGKTSRVDPKVLKLLKLAANNPSAEEAKSALGKALEMLDEPQYFRGARLDTEHIGERSSTPPYEMEGFDLVLEVDPGGRFFVSYNGEARLGSAETKEEAIEKAKATLLKARKRVRVPFITEKGEKATAIGHSLSTGGVLCRGEDGKKFELDRYERGTFDGNAPVEEVIAYREALAARERAEDAIRAFRDRHKLDLRMAVDAAIKDVALLIETEA